MEQITEVQSLRDVVKFELPLLFKRPHLTSLPLVIGIIGLNGEGKSIASATIALLDYMVEGITCWSNMEINATFDINEEIAGKYGAEPGQVSFKSEPLDKAALLRFDPMYNHGVLVLEEINMQFAEPRRSMSNTNLFFDTVGQQKRKRQLSIIYNVVHEMWVDTRIRETTDIFIKCEDTALSPEGLLSKKPPGVNFKWVVYPMTRYLTGVSYTQTRRPLAPVYFYGKPMWGIFDSEKEQALELRKYGTSTKLRDTKADIEIQESEARHEVRSTWGWLYEKIQQLQEQQVDEILDKHLYDYLEIDERGLSPHMIGRQLSALGIKKRGSYYLISNYNLDSLNDLAQRSAL